MNISDRISDIIQRKMKENRVTGASVSVVSEGETVFSRGFGWADKENRVPVASETVFKIGSITKVFTASAVMKLHEQGLLDIDKPVKEYIPEFFVKSRFADAAQITVRNILCHHAGLPCDNLKNYFTNDPFAFHSAIVHLQNAYLVCPPKTMFYYSNLGYEILGVIISRVCGLPYHEYITSVVLKDLGMTASAVSPSADYLKNLAKPYRKGKVQVEEMMKGIPEGGIHSTALDMATFAKVMLNNGKGFFSNSETLQSMLVPQYPDAFIDMDFRNGLGWFVGKPGLDCADAAVWHDGGTPHYFSLFILIPGRRLGIAMLTNSTTGALMNHTAANDILGIVLREKHGLVLPSNEGAMPASQSPEAQQAAAGRFMTIAGTTTVSVSGNNLVAHTPTGTFVLDSCKDGWYSLRLLLFGLLPVRLKILSNIRLGILEHNGEKILAVSQLGFRSPQGRQYRRLPVPHSWKKRAGLYRCVEEKNPRLKAVALKPTPDGMTLSVATDKMGRLCMFLDIVNETEAITVGYGRFAGETIVANEKGVSVFGLWFARTSETRLKLEAPLS